ncbi:SNF2 family N-terminal domain-containing protein [Xylariaceae sp. FL0016]|nr:SNF2 family N-terminal domain-containing protein [Xylariaceae sp. FL0016]
MARTRRSLAVGDTPDSANASKEPSYAAPPSTSTIAPKRGRGRPPKAATNSASDTASSAPTPNTISDNEYSTPATSTAVTPAPSTSLKQASSASIIIDLDDLEEPSGRRKPKGFGALANARRARQKKRGIPDSDEDDEDELFGDDQSRDAKVARRLQRKEWDEVEATPPVPTQSALTTPMRRSNRLSSQRGPSNADRATGPTAHALRNTVIVISNDDSDCEVAEEDDSDTPLSRSVPARKKQKTSHIDNDSNVDSGDDDVYLENEDSAASEASEATEDGDSESDESDNAPPAQVARSRGAAARGGRGSARGSASRNRRIRRGQPGYLPPSQEKFHKFHPDVKTMWTDLKNAPSLKAGKAEQPSTISRQLKPFQLEGLAWLKAMENTKWKGGLLGDEMGLGKTIQAVSLIMSDYPAKSPSLVLVPPVALMQWTSEIASYTDGQLKTLVIHGTNAKSKNLSVKELKKFDVLLMSYNSLESSYRKQEKGFKRKEGLYKEKSAIHQINFHRVILDEAHSIKTRTTMTAKACFALKTDYRWCLSGTPLQNRIGEFFSLIRFLRFEPYASYFCKDCPCSSLEWSMGEDKAYCTHCKHGSMRHVSVFNQEILNPIQQYGNRSEGADAFKKLRLLTDRIMLRRLKKDHTSSMELPVKEIYVDREFFGEEENDFANSIMGSGQRKFETYVAQGVLLNNYANIFGLIMQMRQVADHPDLILRKSGEGGQNVIHCCICDEPAEEAIRSRCKHDFCRSCAQSYVNSQDQPDCPQCHIPLSVDLEQPTIEQDEDLVKKSSIINRINMSKWTSSSKIEMLVHELHKLRSDNAMHKSIIFSQFTTMLQLVEWRLRRAGISTVMLDGSMTPAQRQASIDHFMNNVDVECFLVSLKAGGVALNLVEASRVFIVDPWWNPAAEWQSADRCHRIGQTRPCTITRLCIEDSVESRMVLLQEKKANMIRSTINADDAATESLTPEDLQFLFRGN